MTIAGYDKVIVGDFCATIRRQRPPEPYKGKGIRYTGEVIKLKEGKVGCEMAWDGLRVRGGSQRMQHVGCGNEVKAYHAY